MRTPNHADRVDPWKLQVTLARLGLTRRQAAERCGITAARFYDIAIACRTHPPAGFRESVERALGLDPGALKL